jgi:hypothetical protein
MTWASVDGVVGSPPISFAGAPDTTQKMPLGTILSAVDPYWGGAEFIYLQMPLSTALKVGGVLSYDAATAFLAAQMANTAILGKAAALAVNVVASSASAQYGWGCISGQFPCWSSGTIAANTGLGIVAAGQAGTLAAGKALNGCRVTLPATTAVAKTAKTVNGSPTLQVSTTDGWFPGIAVTGTGIPASTIISSLGVDGKTVTMSANATADGSVTVTGTYNDATNFFNIVTCNRLSMQGPIT